MGGLGGGLDWNASFINNIWTNQIGDTLSLDLIIDSLKEREMYVEEVDVSIKSCLWRLLNIGSLDLKSKFSPHPYKPQGMRKWVD